MFSLTPELRGTHIRLEPLGQRHAAGLAAAAAGAGPALYRWTYVPRDAAAAAAYIAAAAAQRDAGTAVPFAVVTAAGTVLGSSRLWDLAWWPWPPGHPRHGRAGPDTAEIGHTWLGPAAIGTAANAEMKLLMLGLAFDGWQALSVCFHTDARNERSRAALARIGAQPEGVLRAHRLGADLTPRDSARFSVTAPDWPAVRQHLTARRDARPALG